MYPYANYTDEQLLALTKDGNEPAFTEIYHRHFEKLFAIAYNFSKRKDVAEEIVQDVFMRLWDRRNLVEIASLSAYLATAVKFSVFAYLQKELRQKNILQKITPTSVAHSEESAIYARFLKAYIEEAVQALPEKCRIVYRYRRESGLSVKEIAEEMQLAPKTVENHLLRALQTLRIILRNVYLSLALLFLSHFF